MKKCLLPESRMIPSSIPRLLTNGTKTVTCTPCTLVRSLMCSQDNHLCQTLIFLQNTTFIIHKKPPDKNDPDCHSSQFSHFHREAFFNSMKQITASCLIKKFILFQWILLCQRFHDCLCLVGCRLTLFDHHCDRLCDLIHIIRV